MDCNSISDYIDILRGLVVLKNTKMAGNATRGQIGILHARYKPFFEDRDSRLRSIAYLIGVDRGSFGKLTRGEASTLIDLTGWYNFDDIVEYAKAITECCGTTN